MGLRHVKENETYHADVFYRRTKDKGGWGSPFIQRWGSNCLVHFQEYRGSTSKYCASDSEEAIGWGTEDILAEHVFIKDGVGGKSLPHAIKRKSVATRILLLIFVCYAVSYRRNMRSKQTVASRAQRLCFTGGILRDGKRYSDPFYWAPQEQITLTNWLLTSLLGVGRLGIHWLS